MYLRIYCVSAFYVSLQREKESIYHSVAENVPIQCRLLLQVAVVVPDPEVLPGYASSKLGLKSETMESLCENDQVKKALLDSIIATGKASGLKGFEQVGCIAVYQ